MEQEATIATKRPNTGNASVIETAIFNNKKNQCLQNVLKLQSQKQTISYLQDLVQKIISEVVPVFKLPSLTTSM